MRQRGVCAAISNLATAILTSSCFADFSTPSIKCHLIPNAGESEGGREIGQTVWSIRSRWLFRSAHPDRSITRPAIHTDLAEVS